MINSTTNTSYNFRAIMSDVSQIAKPFLVVGAIVKTPDLLLFIFHDVLVSESISQVAEITSKVGGAIFILFKIYDWVHVKITKKKENEIK